MDIRIHEVIIGLNANTGGWEVRINGMDEDAQQFQQFNGVAPDLASALDQVIDVVATVGEIPQIEEDFEQEMVETPTQDEIEREIEEDAEDG